MKKLGRPTKLTPATVNVLCACVGDGLTYKSACGAAGISTESLRNWREEYPELATKLEKARETARATALREIKAAGAKDWRAHAEWLRLTFPEDYRAPREVPIAAVQINQTQSNLVIPQETLALIRRLNSEAAMESTNGPQQ